MKINFRKYGIGANYWAIENNQGTLLLTTEEAKELAN